MATLVEASLDTAEGRVRAVVMKQTLHRDILSKTLGFCREQRALTDVEDEIATYPEFQCATQDQYHLIGFLVDAGGLDQLEVDVDGEVVCEERKAGLTEDEMDNLVVSYSFVTTAAGLVVFGSNSDLTRGCVTLSPARRSMRTPTSRSWRSVASPGPTRRSRISSLIPASVCSRRRGRPSSELLRERSGDGRRTRLEQRVAAE